MSIKFNLFLSLVLGMGGFHAMELKSELRKKAGSSSEDQGVRTGASSSTLTSVKAKRPDGSGLTTVLDDKEAFVSYLGSNAHFVPDVSQAIASGHKNSVPFLKAVAQYLEREKRQKNAWQKLDKDSRVGLFKYLLFEEFLERLERACEKIDETGNNVVPPPHKRVFVNLLSEVSPLKKKWGALLEEEGMKAIEKSFNDLRVDVKIKECKNEASLMGYLQSKREEFKAPDSESATDFLRLLKDPIEDFESTYVQNMAQTYLDTAKRGLFSECVASDNRDVLEWLTAHEVAPTTSEDPIQEARSAEMIKLLAKKLGYGTERSVVLKSVPNDRHLLTALLALNPNLAACVGNGETILFDFVRHQGPHVDDGRQVLRRLRKAGLETHVKNDVGFSVRDVLRVEIKRARKEYNENPSELSLVKLKRLKALQKELRSTKKKKESKKPKKHKKSKKKQEG